jgi:hypothetical protein
MVKSGTPNYDYYEMTNIQFNEYLQELASNAVPVVIYYTPDEPAKMVFENGWTTYVNIKDAQDE